MASAWTAARMAGKGRAVRLLASTAAVLQPGEAVKRGGGRGLLPPPILESHEPSPG